jgi:hypothetical protein
VGEVLSHILALMGYMGGWCNILETSEESFLESNIYYKYLESARAYYKEGP